MKELKLNIQMFANPTATGGTNELQERYAQDVLKIARKKTVLRNTASRMYEGSPKAGAVKIPVRDTEVTVGNYDVVAGATLTTSATTYMNVLVDKHKAINELIDGYEANAVPDNIQAQRLVSGGYSMGLTAENDFITELTTNGTQSTIGTTASTKTTIYDNISTDIGKLLDLGIDPSTIKVAITTATEGLLLSDEKYTNTASQVGSERAMNGVVNMIRGAEVLRSSLLPADVEYVVYSTDYAQAGDEWVVNPSINDLKDGTHIGASALQGRISYFNKLTRAYGCQVKKFV